MFSDKWNRRFMELAFMVASWSKDPSTKTGAVVVGPDREIRATGYNGLVRGVDDNIPERMERPTKYDFFEHAERNAIFHMITNGENALLRVIAVDRSGKAIPPCGACREFMAQLMPDSYHSFEIMLDYEKGKIVTLGSLTPEWWI